MTRRNLIWAVLAVVGGGLAYAGTQRDKAYTCPVTGEQLACEKCCPLNSESALLAATPVAESSKVKTNADYVCPLTGETLNCPKCCPLNEKK